MKSNTDFFGVQIFGTGVHVCIDVTARKTNVVTRCSTDVFYSEKKWYKHLT